MKKSIDINVQYLIESLVLARNMLLGAVRWIKPKNTSASVLPRAVEALLASTTGDETVFCSPNPNVGAPPTILGARVSESGVPGVLSPVAVRAGYIQSVAFDENRSRETNKLSLFVVNAGGSGEIGD